MSAVEYQLLSAQLPNVSVEHRGSAYEFSRYTMSTKNGMSNSARVIDPCTDGRRVAMSV